MKYVTLEGVNFNGKYEEFKITKLNIFRRDMNVNVVPDLRDHIARKSTLARQANAPITAYVWIYHRVTRATLINASVHMVRNFFKPLGATFKLLKIILTGYTGKNCQFESDPCNPSQCLNGGTCVGNSTHFR